MSGSRLSSAAGRIDASMYSPSRAMPGAVEVEKQRPAKHAHHGHHGASRVNELLASGNWLVAGLTADWLAVEAHLAVAPMMSPPWLSAPPT